MNGIAHRRNLPALSAQRSVLLFHDELTDTDGTEPSAHTPAPYNLLSLAYTGDSNVEIRNNRFQGDTAGQHGFPRFNLGRSDAAIQGLVNHAAGLYTGLIGRMKILSDGWWAARLADGSAVKLMENWIERGSAAVSSGQYTLRLECRGSSIKVLVDGVEKIAYTSSSMQSETRFGVWVYNEAASWVDDLKVFGL